MPLGHIWGTTDNACRPDPVEWCPRGYAIVNVDIRGSWDSEGNLYIEGSQMGKSESITTEIYSSEADITQVLMAMIPLSSLRHCHGAMVMLACAANIG